MCEAEGGEVEDGEMREAEDGEVEGGEVEGGEMEDGDVEDGGARDAAFDFDVGDPDALHSFVASNGTLRLKEEWTVAGLDPRQMHVALVQNIDPAVDWQVVVVWTCLLILYQAQVAADAEASAAFEAARVEAEASRASAENRAAEVKAAADKAAAATQLQANKAATKASEARNARAFAEKALREAETDTKRERFAKADDRAKTLQEKADEAKTKADDAVEDAKRAASALDELRSRAESGNPKITAEAAESAVVADERLPEVLEDYYDSQPDPPSEQDFRPFWRSTITGLCKGMKAPRMLLGEAQACGQAPTLVVSRRALLPALAPPDARRRHGHAQPARAVQSMHWWGTQELLQPVGGGVRLLGGWGHGEGVGGGGCPGETKVRREKSASRLHRRRD